MSPTEPSLRDRIHYMTSFARVTAAGESFPERMDAAQGVFDAAAKEDLDRQAAAFDAQMRAQDDYFAEQQGYLDAEAGIGEGAPDVTYYGK